LSDFLERGEHLSRLSQALARAGEGRGRILALAGPAGTGKTTLVERFARDRRDAARIFSGACENLSTPEPLLPLRDIARANGTALDLSHGHLAAFETLLDLLRQGAKPALLILEDVHWADAATLDLIRFLGRRIAQVKALVLITYRDDEVGSPSPLKDILAEAPAGSVERMALEELSLPAVTLLAEKAGRDGKQLYALTGGNPFLVTESLAAEVDATPESVRDATLARAARLPADARAVLEAVSIFPRRADRVTVAQLVAGGFDAGLDACAERGMLRIEGDVLTFRHELARRAIAQSLLPSRRRALHQKALHALQSARQARPSEIAHHAEQAGDIPTLVASARQAGEDAVRAGSPREAAAHFAAMLRHRQALAPDAIVEILERHAEQSYLMGASHVAVISMREAAEMRRATGDWVALGRDLTRLTRYYWVCSRRDEAEQAVTEAIAVLEKAGAGAELAWAYSHKSQLDMLASKQDSAISWGEKALALAEKSGAQEALIHALGNIGTARMERSGLESEELTRSLELARSAGLHDHFERASCNLSCSAYWRRDMAKAFEYIDMGARYAVERGLPHWEAYMRGWRAMALLDLGDWQMADMESQTIAGWSGVPDLYRSPALFALARVRVRRGDPDADTPLELARRCTATVKELQRDIYTAAIAAERAWLARGAVESSDTGSNEQVHSDSEVVARLRDVHILAIERKLQWVVEDSALWLHLLGEPVAAAKLSQPYRAHCSGDWREAATQWRKRGRPYEEALALSGGDEAAQRDALAIFDRLGAAPAAAKLRRQMRMAGVRAVPRGPIAGTRANSAGLTRRQAQVLGLLGDGLTNPEIADRLCISAKTAEHHVSAIMARFEAGTRRQAIDAARKLGLLEGAKG
jgi:DNA-binding CsgD family transcriptional regulator/tetratricopeptide (TPR) repeat protein